MSQSFVVWALFAPLLAAALTSLVSLAVRTPERRTPALILRVILLALACAGPITQGILAAFTPGSFNLPGIDLQASVSPLAIVGVAAVDAALICLLLLPPGPSEEDGSPQPFLATVWAGGLCATLLSGAMLFTDPIAQAFCLMLASVVAISYAVYPLPHPTPDKPDAQPPYALTLRLSGAIKYAVVAAGATLLLVAGNLFLARFPFNMENAATLSTGLGLLSVGIFMRAAAAPFSGGLADFARSSPRAAILTLGALIPASLVAGATMLAPIVPRLAEASQPGRQVALALGCIASLLSGFGALAASRRDASIPLLYASAAGVQVGWALFGVLSASPVGFAGAALLAANLAITVPLAASAAAGNLWAARLGAASLLGLPPLGGFAGTLLVGTSAVQTGGPWLALLLVGSIMAAVAWLRAPSETPSELTNAYTRTFSYVLLFAQAVLLVLSVPLAGILASS